MVQDEALTHGADLMPLILRRNQDWKHARAELFADVLHGFTVWTTCIDRAFTLEVGAEDAVIRAISTPPVLVPVLFLSLHLLEQL